MWSIVFNWKQFLLRLSDWTQPPWSGRARCCLQHPINYHQWQIDKSGCTDSLINTTEWEVFFLLYIVLPFSCCEGTDGTCSRMGTTHWTKFNLIFALRLWPTSGKVIATRSSRVRWLCMCFWYCIYVYYDRRLVSSGVILQATGFLLRFYNGGLFYF